MVRQGKGSREISARRLRLPLQPHRSQPRHILVDRLLLAAILVPGNARLLLAQLEALGLLGGARRCARFADKRLRSALRIGKVGAHYWLGFLSLGTDDGPITGATLATGVRVR